jgi:two-component sensor histidine kinase
MRSGNFFYFYFIFKQSVSKTISCILFFLFTAISLVAQKNTSGKQEFERHYSLALKYKDVSLYANCLKELNTAIDLAQENRLDEQTIEARILLGEILRATRDFEEAKEVLLAIKGSERYPKLHVRKLGRIAAVYNELYFPSHQDQYDSVHLYLDQAITLAEKNRFKLEEASLKNELGYLDFRHGNHKEGISFLLESANLFEQYKDTQSYARSMINLLDAYNWGNQRRETDSITTILTKLLHKKSWYLAQIDFYNIVARRHGDSGDSLGYFKWLLKASEANFNQLNASQSQTMATYRVIRETEKLRQESEEKSIALDKQAARTNQLIVYLLILILLFIGGATWLFRERKLKRSMDEVNRQLTVANEKYHELLVESNHRIKNNLQMIISMVDYSSKDSDKAERSSFAKMSAKIHTISALHKHLYLDVHNERVEMDVYFSEIISLYTEFSDTFSVEKSFVSVGVKSERIIYFGLIFNEMLANTIEHNRQPKRIVHISVTTTGNHFLFDYHDNAQWVIGEGKGIGNVLIAQLVKRVGGFNYVCDPSNGLYQFEFHA